MSLPCFNPPVAFYYIQNKIQYLILVYMPFIIWLLALSPNPFPCSSALHWLPFCYLKIISHTRSQFGAFPRQFPLLLQVFQWVALPLTQLKSHLSEKHSLFYLKQNPSHSTTLYCFIFFLKHLLLPYIILQMYQLIFFFFVSCISISAL